MNVSILFTLQANQDIHVCFHVSFSMSLSHLISFRSFQSPILNRTRMTNHLFQSEWPETVTDNRHSSADLRATRVNRSTVGVVARRLLCVWLVAALGCGCGPAGAVPAPCLHARPPLQLCLVVLALKGKRHTICFLHRSQTN